MRICLPGQDWIYGHDQIGTVWQISPGQDWISGHDQIKSTLRMIRSYVEKNCENVGENFAKEARLINEGASKPRGIYGKASKQEAEELIDEGIDLTAIPWVKDDS